MVISLEKKAFNDAYSKSKNENDDFVILQMNYEY